MAGSGFTGQVSQYSPEGFDRMINDIKGIMTQISAARDRFHGLDLDRYVQYDEGNKLNELEQALYDHSCRLLTLQRNAEHRKASLDRRIAEGTADFEVMEDLHYDVSAFGPAVTAAVVAAYPTYQCYQFLLNSELSFSKNFNDIGVFMNSDFYKAKSLLQTGYSMMTDWRLWGKTITGDLDDITGEWLEASLKGVLNSMPDAAAAGFTGVVSWTKAATDGTVLGIDSWVKEVASLAKKYAEAGKSREEFLACDELGYLKSMVAGMDDKTLEQFLDGFLDKEAWEACIDLADTADKAAKLAERVKWIDLACESMSHAITDHSAQLQYLAAMKKALEEDGNIYGPAYQCIEKVERDYRNSAVHAINSAWGPIRDDLVSSLKKDLISAAKESGGKIGGQLIQADKVLSTGSTVVKLMAGKDIEADKALMGLRQYDEVLTRAFEGYAEKMRDGMASESDMQDAERLYQLLLGTKKKEYESMIQMLGGTGAAVGIYQSKYDQLLELEQQIAEQAKNGLPLISGEDLDRFSSSYHT